jgi:BirA family biotin operon repressor/biotin-[acetyl-CoA-carboxylase] ligase
MSQELLLSVLSDGKFHSGDELGEMLGVSRTAVWKQLKKIEELGLSLVSVKGKGYCVEGGLDLLNADTISASLSDVAETLVSDIDVRSVVDSTNAIAMGRAALGRGGYICTAEQQTAGKGRRGKTWHSPYASNLYLSVVWEFSAGAVALEGLSLAVGIAVVEALKKSGVSGAALKWPNDVLHDSKKMAGILLEMTGDAAGPCHVVIGIGLNVAMSEGAVIDQPWTDVYTVNPSAANRNKLLALILNELMPILATFQQQGFSAYRDRWVELDAFMGKDVAILLGEELVMGVACGVDDSGAIVLETATGERRTYNGGEGSLRIAG